MAQLKSTSVTGNLSVTGNVVASNKIIQGASNSDSSIAGMNQFNADLFVSGNGSAPNAPKIPGFYLGKSQSDDNRHMDIVTGSTVAYIDFNRADVQRDYDVRLRVDGDSGLVRFQWGSGYANNILQLESGILQANGIEIISGNLNSADYDRIYVGKNNFVSYRTKTQFINDLDLSHVYNYKGTVTWNELKNIAAANVGDVYHISDADPNGKTATNWACKAEVTAATGNNYATYWQSIGNTISLSGYVTKDTDQTITGVKTFTKNVIINNNLLSIKAISENDDSWIRFSNYSDGGFYAVGIRRPYENYGLQLKIHPVSGDDTYYSIWHTGNLQGNKNHILKFTGTNTIGNSHITESDNYIFLNLATQANKTIYVCQDESSDATDYRPGGIQLGRNGLINATHNEGNEFKTVLGININQSADKDSNILYLGNDAFETKMRGNTNILNGKLWLTSNAHFQYNTDDKCIDVLFT